MSIRVMQSGLLTTVQDLGRFGYQQYGVPVSGAMDRFSCQLANLLVGNDENAAVLECTLLGPSLSFDADHLIAVTGADLNACLNGHPLSMNTAIRVSPGDELTFSAARSGCRSYIAFSGGLDVPLRMGSRSTYLKAEIGGYQGRALKSGDSLSILPVPSSLSDDPFRLNGFHISVPTFSSSAFSPITVRVILGPQEDEFTKEGLRTFLSGTYKVSEQSDRMGYRLSGEKIEHIHDGNIVSDGIAFGSIQVPPSGQPIIMLSDRQTTGGYPKIATVCSVDLGKIAQARPGDTIHFQAITIEEAQSMLIEQRNALRKIKKQAMNYQPASPLRPTQKPTSSDTVGIFSASRPSLLRPSKGKDYEITVNGKTYHVHVEEG